MGGGQYINRLNALFKWDILRKPIKGVGLERDRSAYSFASESSKRLASEMDQSVVSLVSFDGFAKKFSCTCVFIKGKACSATILTSASLLGSEHMIDDNLRIEVCLPNGYRVVRILKSYNLHYNVALVEIMGFWNPRGIKISGDPVTSSMDVIAVGPLIDIDGNFAGMNFYVRKKLHSCQGMLFIASEITNGVVHMILLLRVLKTDGCCLAGHIEMLILLQRWTETNGHCQGHDACFHLKFCIFANGLYLSHVTLLLDPPDHLHHGACVYRMFCIFANGLYRSHITFCIMTNGFCLSHVKLVLSDPELLSPPLHKFVLVLLSFSDT